MSFLFPLKPFFFPHGYCNFWGNVIFFYTELSVGDLFPGQDGREQEEWLRICAQECSLLLVQGTSSQFEVFCPFLKYSVAHGDRDETIRLHVWDVKDLHWGAQTICTSVHDAAVPKEGRPERGTIHLIKFLDKIKGLMWKVGKIFSRDFLGRGVFWLISVSFTDLERGFWNTFSLKSTILCTASSPVFKFLLLARINSNI